MTSTNERILYGFIHSPATQIVLLTAYEKELLFHYRSINIFQGQHRTAEYTALQPFGKIPTYVENQFAVYECRAISKYIDQKYHTGIRLIPTDLISRTQMEQWMSIEQTEIHPKLHPIIDERIIGKLFGRMTVDEQIIKKAVSDLELPLNILEKRLSEAKYLAGENISLADLVFLPSFHVLTQLPEASLLQSRPHLWNWLQELKQRPSWRKIEKALASTPLK